MTEMGSTQEYEEISDEEMEQLQEVYEQYEKMLKEEEENEQPQVGFCGYPCNFGCNTCINCGYDDSDEL